MRNKKVVLAGLIAALMGISLVGCGSSNDVKKNVAETEQVTETETETEDTDDVTDASSEEETDTEAASETTEFTIPVYEDFTLAPGLSEKYVDMDNRSFVYNGKKFTLGESTLKDLVDGGIPFNENDLNNIARSNSFDKF